MRIQVNDTQAVVKSHSIFAMISIGAVLMFFIGGSAALELFSSASEVSSADIFGGIFICIWLAVVLWMGVYGLVTASKKLTVDAEGVCCSSLFYKRSLAWREIRDFGLSYAGQTRGEGNTYYLYFASSEQKTKNECKKKLKGKMIKIEIIGGEYQAAVSELIPFCRKFTTVEPFVGEDKFHLI